MWAKTYKVLGPAAPLLAAIGIDVGSKHRGLRRVRGILQRCRGVSPSTGVHCAV